MSSHFGAWYGRLRFLRNYHRYGLIWRLLDRVSDGLPDYLAGMDTSWYYRANR